MSHIDALNAFERSAVYQPFYMLSLAARVLHFKRREAKAEATLNDIGFTGKAIWPDLYDAAFDECSDAREKRSKLIAEYVKDRGMRAGVRVAA